jgi:hypothetical protein
MIQLTLTLIIALTIEGLTFYALNNLRKKNKK